MKFGLDYSNDKTKSGVIKHVISTPMKVGNHSMHPDHHIVSIQYDPRKH